MVVVVICIHHLLKLLITVIKDMVLCTSNTQRWKSGFNYIVTEGEGYPVEDDSPLVIDKVIIVNPGTGYGDNTFVTDQFDNEYDVEVFNGSIVRVTP